MTVKAKADAIDRFVRTIKASGVYDDINAACIMAGWTNLAGALYPFKGSAPTNNGFLAADLDAGIGLKGDGSSKYLDSNRANNADSATDCHLAVFAAAAASGPLKMYIGGQISNPYDIYRNNDDINFRSGLVDGSKVAVGGGNNIGLIAHARAAANAFSIRTGGVTTSGPAGSRTPEAVDVFVYARNNNGTADYRSDATLSWYSIGSATDLAALDSAVSTLMADLRAIDEDGFEPESVNYLRAVEAADGAYLETGVKKAINSFVVGCKKDGIWDALKASCILCGARTIAGALVPLAGTAPTALGGWSSGDYNRETGLVGNGSTKYLDSNRANNADGQNDAHLAVYKSDTTSAANPYFIGDFSAGSLSAVGQNGMYLRNADFFAGDGFASSSVGLHAASRQNASTVTFKRPGFTVQSAAKASVPIPSALNAFVFAGNNAGSPSQPSASRLAFYSIGSAISDLAILDARVTTLVSQIAAAIS